MKKVIERVYELNFKVNISYKDEFIQDKQQQDTEQLMFVFWGILIPIIALVGIIGNTLTILVLWRREMKSTTIYFLRTLVITDMGIIVGGVLGLSIIAITQTNPAMWRFNDIVYPHIFTPTNYIVMTLQMINVWVTVAVTVERYVAICHPFRSAMLLKRRNAFIMIAVISAVSVLYNIPRCLAYKVNSEPCETETGTCYSVISSDFGKTSFFTDWFSIWLYLFIIYIIPFVILSVLNTLLIIELMRMRRRRTVTNERENSEMNMSVVLVLIVVVFIICQTPGLVSQFQFFDSMVLLKFMCISNTLFVLNSSVNFLIYTAVGKKFRKVLLKTFHVFKRRGSEFTRSFSGGTELSKLASPNGNIPDPEETDENSKLKLHG